jgi:hypothetical protein
MAAQRELGTQIFLILVGKVFKNIPTPTWKSILWKMLTPADSFHYYICTVVRRENSPDFLVTQEGPVIFSPIHSRFKMDSNGFKLIQIGSGSWQPTPPPPPLRLFFQAVRLKLSRALPTLSTFYTVCPSFEYIGINLCFWSRHISLKVMSLFKKISFSLC